MDKSKLIMIVGAVFIVIALALSTVSVVMMSSLLKQVKGDKEAVEEEGEVKTVPLSQSIYYDLENPIVAVIKSKESGVTMNKSIEIGFRLDSKNKKAEDIMVLLESSQSLIRDRIGKLIEKKTVEDFEKPNFTVTLQSEILNMVSKEMDTDAIVEVYFKNNLGTSR